MPTASQLSVRVRWMVGRDLPEAAKLSAWTVADFKACLIAKNRVVLVAQDASERVVGFVAYKLHTSRLELQNIAVHPSVHRKGVASELMQHLIRKLWSHRRDRLTLHVRETNLAAQLFFRSVGMRATKIVHDTESGENDYAMEIRVTADTENCHGKHSVAN